jgi:hypothetical protein
MASGIVSKCTPFLTGSASRRSRIVSIVFRILGMFFGVLLRNGREEQSKTNPTGDRRRVTECGKNKEEQPPRLKGHRPEASAWAMGESGNKEKRNLIGAIIEQMCDLVKQNFCGRVELRWGPFPEIFTQPGATVVSRARTPYTGYEECS